MADKIWEIEVGVEMFDELFWVCNVEALLLAELLKKDVNLLVTLVDVEDASTLFCAFVDKSLSLSGKCITFFSSKEGKSLV